LPREIDRPEAAEQSYIDVGVQIFEPARKSCSSGSSRAKAPPAQLRTIELLLKDGEARVTFRQPFDLLAETTAMAARQEAENTANSAKSEIWLGN
jgi:hypothetical protein